MSLPPYTGTIVQWPASYGTVPPSGQAGQGAAGVPVNLLLSKSNPGYSVALQGIFPLGLNNIQTVYIDNSQSPFQLRVQFQEPGSTIEAAPYSCGYYAVFTNNLTVQIYAVFTAATNVLMNGIGPYAVTVIFYNYIVPPSVWQPIPYLSTMDAGIPNYAGTLCTHAEMTTPNQGVSPISLPGAAAGLTAIVTGFTINYSQTTGQAVQTAFGVGLLDASISNYLYLSVLFSAPSAVMNATVVTLSGLSVPVASTALQLEGPSAVNNLTANQWWLFADIFYTLTSLTSMRSVP
jgi:hypothetical protein